MDQVATIRDAVREHVRNTSAPSEEECACRGGWHLSDWDSWEACPFHYEAGQPHPEDHPDDVEAYYLNKAREEYKALAKGAVAEFGRFGVDAAVFNKHAALEVAEIAALPFSSGAAVDGPQQWVDAAKAVVENLGERFDFSV